MLLRVSLNELAPQRRPVRDVVARWVSQLPTIIVVLFLNYTLDMKSLRNGSRLSLFTT